MDADRKGKGSMEYGSDDSPSERARRAREMRTAVRAMARAAAAPYAREDGINPGRNAAPSRLDIQAPHPTGRHPGVVLGGRSTSSRHDLHGQAQDWGFRRTAPPPMASCPVCLYAIFYNNTICMVCACAETVRSFHEGPIPEERSCSACRVYPGREVDEPRRNVCRCAVCQFFRGGAVCPVCISALGFPPPQPRHQQHLGLLDPNITRIFLPVPARSSSSSSTWQRQPTAMGDSASAMQVLRPEGPPPASTGITVLDRHSGHAERSPSTSPWDSIDATPVYGDLWCPACTYHRAPTLSEPWPHVCYCATCIKVDRLVCPVCASPTGKGASTSRPDNREGP